MVNGKKRERNPLKNSISPSTAKGSTERKNSDSKRNMKLVAQTISVQAKKSGVEILRSKLLCDLQNTRQDLIKKNNIGRHSISVVEVSGRSKALEAQHELTPSFQLNSSVGANFSPCGSPLSDSPQLAHGQSS